LHPLQLGRRRPGIPLHTDDADLEHRRQVRGLLALIRAIVQRTATPVPAVTDYTSHLMGRLDALARIQDILMRDPDQLDLAELAADEFLAQGISPESITAPPVSLMVDRKVAASLALALHELATNAIKFGHLELPSRWIQLRWNAVDDPPGWVLLQWREQAQTAEGAIAAPVPGFGFELIRKTLPYEIGARTRIELLPDGLACDILFDPKGVQQ